MTRASLFRETKGVAVEMVNRVFDLPAFSGEPISFMSVDFCMRWSLLWSICMVLSQHEVVLIYLVWQFFLASHRLPCLSLSLSLSS